MDFSFWMFIIEFSIRLRSGEVEVEVKVLEVLILLFDFLFFSSLDSDTGFRMW